jgi:hypothetical protein
MRGAPLLLLEAEKLGEKGGSASKEEAAEDSGHDGHARSRAEPEPGGKPDNERNQKGSDRAHRQAEEERPADICISHADTNIGGR